MTRLWWILLLVPPAMPEELYRKPPQAILDVLQSPAPPQPSLSPDRRFLLLAQPVRYPSIADLARPMLRLAGRRIDPSNNGPHRPGYYTALDLQPLPAPDSSRLPALRKLKLPPGAHIGPPVWSPDGRRFAFLRYRETTIELWVGEAAAGDPRPLLAGVNAALGEPFAWLPDQRSLLVETVPSGRGAPPKPPAAPAGPNIQETSGNTAPVRTFQDLLQNAHDEALFDYYATSQLTVINVETGRASAWGPPGIFRAFRPSPDGEYLFVARLRRPYSRLHPLEYFPAELEIWDRQGRRVRTIASLPVAEVPIDGVPVGPRLVTWKPTEPATLFWAEALDEGNPKKKVPHRDRLLALRAPFTSEPTEAARIEQRLTSIDWFEKEDVAWLTDYDRDRRWLRTFTLEPGGAPQVVFSRNLRDRYRDPGAPVRRVLPNGHRAIWQHDGAIFLSGAGATREGDRPFLDRFSWRERKTERLFRSGETSYEYAAALLSEDGRRFLTSYETPTEPPNLYVRTAGDAARRAVTAFPDPTPQIRGITKQRVLYERHDGVQLSFTLYLPPGYQAGTRLPTVVWAYPREFSDAGTAGQVSGSTQRFTTLAGTSHLFFALAGYAVLDDAAMPVIGDPETVNNTYVEQIVAGARAAVEKAAAMGVTDPQRVGVGGHSYGAFMTANLLAHSDLFRAGIARSGAHNRTLTPFGFQSEPRTLWEAPEVYLRMSPLMAAHKIKEPLLLIHGEADNNPGTFPMQSERMYQALRGNGGTARLVMLPYESHGYVAFESVAHTLAEMIEWFDRHVKNAPPHGGDSGAE